MTQRAFTVGLFFLAISVLACRTVPQSRRPPRELVAVTEEAEALAVLRGHEGQWRQVATLPRTARALRFSLFGEVIAWIEDDTSGPKPVMRGFVQKVGDAAPTPLGALGIRRAEAMGIDVAPDGRVVYLRDDGSLVDHDNNTVVGAGTHPLFGDSGELSYVTREHCLSGITPELCGAALRPLDWQGGVLLARTNVALILRDAQTTHSLPMRDVIDARRRPEGSMVLLTHRIDEDGITREAVSLWPGNQMIAEVARADVIVNAEWDGNAVLVVRQPERASLYDSMLAHAPEEFGGEALAGEAIRIDLETKTERPVEGLSGWNVRRLFSVPLREHP